MDAKARDHEFRGTSLATITSMVAGGAGVTLLPELSVPSEVRMKELRVRRFSDPTPARTIGLVRRKKSSLAPALRKLAGTMRQAYPAPALDASTGDLSKRRQAAGGSGG